MALMACRQLADGIDGMQAASCRHAIGCNRMLCLNRACGCQAGDIAVKRGGAQVGIEPGTCICVLHATAHQMVACAYRASAATSRLNLAMKSRSWKR
jgi:hypothetical protein